MPVKREDVLALVHMAAVASRIAFAQDPTMKKAWRVVSSYGWYLWKLCVCFPERPTT
jgi:hypothetical protein